MSHRGLSTDAGFISASHAHPDSKSFQEVNPSRNPQPESQSATCRSQGGDEGGSSVAAAAATAGVRAAVQLAEADVAASGGAGVLRMRLHAGDDGHVSSDCAGRRERKPDLTLVWCCEGSAAKVQCIGDGRSIVARDDGQVSACLQLAAVCP